MSEHPKYKILMVHNAYQTRGGEEESAESEARVLREAGHHVEYVSVHNDTIETPWDKMSAAASAIWSRRWYRRVTRMLTEQKFDVLHAQNLFPQISPSVYYAARRAGVPIVQAVRNYRMACPAATLLRDGSPCTDCVGKRVKLPGIRHRCYRGSAAASATVAAVSGLHGLVGSWTRNVDLYLAVSNWVADVLVDEGLPRDKIAVKPCFTYLHHQSSQMPRARKDVLFVGRLSQEKGLPTLLRAWSQIQTPAKLKIIGEGELPSDIPENVEILGRKSPHEVQKAMSEAALVVMPGNWAEPFGRVAVEAFSQATPVVATNIGGVSDIVRPGVNGELFDRRNADDLANKIQSLLLDEKKRARYGREALATYQAEYSPEQNLKFLESAYATVTLSAASSMGRLPTKNRIVEPIG